MPPGRLVCLNVEGISVQAWREDVIYEIAGECGRVIDMDNINFGCLSLHRAKVLILSSSFEEIRKEIPYFLDDRKISAWVSEKTSGPITSIPRQSSSPSKTKGLPHLLSPIFEDASNKRDLEEGVFGDVDQRAKSLHHTSKPGFGSKKQVSAPVVPIAWNLVESKRLEKPLASWMLETMRWTWREVTRSFDLVLSLF